MNLQSISRIFLSMVLSLSLFCLQIDLSNFKVRASFNGAWAQSTSTTVQDTDGQLAVDRTETIKGEEAGSGAGSLLTMIALGILMAGMIANCRKASSDVIVIAVAGLAFIAGEVVAIKEFKDTEKDIQAKYRLRADGKKVDSNSAQIEALKAQLDLLKKEGKTANTKKKLQSLAMSAVMGMTLMALLKSITDTTMFQSIKGWFASDQATCAPPTYTLTCGCVGLGAAAEGVIQAREATVQLPAPSIVNNQVIITYEAEASAFALACPQAQAAIAAAITKAKEGATFCSPVNLTNNDIITPFNEQEKSIADIDKNNIFINKLNEVKDLRITKFINFIKPILMEAKANPAVNLGLGATAAILVLTLTKGIWSFLDTFMGTPFKRAIVYGILTAMIKSAVDATDDVIEANQEKQKKIQQLIAKLNGLGNNGLVALNTQSAESQQVIPSSIGVSSFDQSNDEIKLENPLPCPSSPTKNKSKCTSVAKGIDAAFSGFPDGTVGLEGLVEDIKDVGDGLGGQSSIPDGVIESAESGAKAIGTLAKKISRAKVLLQKELDKNPNNKTSFRDQELNAAKRFNKLLNKLNPNGNVVQLASIAPTTGAKAKEDADAEKKALTKVNKLANKRLAARRAAPRAKGFSFDFDDEELGADSAELDEGFGDGGLEEGEEYVVNDINEKQEASIFKIISTRYLQSGFDRLFEEDKK